MVVLYIVIAIVLFSFLIFIHELGHFLAAKGLGVQVNEFSLCMGPAIWQRTKGETTYSLRCIPIGGYCAMEGEDEDSDNPRAFGAVAWWRRLIILAAGAFMNFVAGFLIMVILLAPSAGFTDLTISGFFDDGGLAAQGLQVGDELYAVDGQRLYLTSDLDLLASRDGDGVMDLTVLRDGEKVTLEDFTLQKGTYRLDGEDYYGYGISLTAVPRTVGRVVENAWYYCLDFVRMVWMGLEDLVSGAIGLDQMSGVVGIVDVIADTGASAPTVSVGLFNVAYLGAFIAVNLAVMNLLPIPALDGGRIVCLLLTTVVEKLTRRKLNPKYEGWLHAAGMVALLGLMVYVTFQDVFRIIGG